MGGDRKEDRISLSGKKVLRANIRGRVFEKQSIFLLTNREKAYIIPDNNAEKSISSPCVGCTESPPLMVEGGRAHRIGEYSLERRTENISNVSRLRRVRPITRRGFYLKLHEGRAAATRFRTRGGNTF